PGGSVPPAARLFAAPLELRRTIAWRLLRPRLLADRLRPLWPVRPARRPGLGAGRTGRPADRPIQRPDRPGGLWRFRLGLVTLSSARNPAAAAPTSKLRSCGPSLA